MSQASPAGAIAKPAKRTKQGGSSGVPSCPACVDAQGRPVECIPEINMTHVRYSCPNGRKCLTGGFYVDDHDSQMKPVDEAFKKTIDAPSHHENTQLGVGAL